MSRERPGEDELIARYFRPLAAAPGAFRLGDDAASLTPPPGEDLVLTKDAVAAGVHFFADDRWDEVARKALRVNLSDLAAKGARPLAYLLALGLPTDWREDDLAAFAAGLADDQARFGIDLLGGDTIRSPGGLVVSITAIGAVPAGGMVRRGTARAGDLVVVTGTIGDAALGLKLRLDPSLADAWGLDQQSRDALLARYLRPEPRTALAAAVQRHARAAMDVSDGLVGDLQRMARVSGVDAEIDVAAVPLSPAGSRAIAREPAALRTILTGGDDYEILAAVPPEELAPLAAAGRAAEIVVSVIGRFVAGEGQVAVRSPSGDALDLGSGAFRHF